MSFRIIVRDALDKDALNYCALSGAADKPVMSAFVRGCKQLGVWDSMICWPLRSSQNAGTGTTVYSLGGLGSFNGTMVNGPVWLPDGVDFDGSNDRIDTSFNPDFNNVCVCVVCNGDNRSTRRTVYSQKNSGASFGMSLFNEGFAFPSETSAEVYDSTWRLAYAGNVTDGQWATLGLYYDKANIVAKRDNVSASAATGTFAGSLNLRIGTDMTYFWDGKVAALIVVHNRGDVFPQLRQLCKDTVAAGLNLP